MHSFLSHNRDDLIERCKAKVARRPRRSATPEQLANGVPMFLDQLIRTLAAEGLGDTDKSVMISGAAGESNSIICSEIAVSTAAHGRKLLELGFTVDQVVHDYGDLCQSITDLALQRDAPFSINEFRTLNRCLDNAIADAVNAFSAQRDATVARAQAAAENERLGFLVHELRNELFTATLAFRALESGSLPIGGSTGAVLKRSLRSLSTALIHAIAVVRLTAGTEVQMEEFSVAGFVEEAKDAAWLHAAASGCSLVAQQVDPQLVIKGNRDLLLAALLNLLQNALKFTRPHTTVTLSAYAESGRISIDVMDNCGGLAPGVITRIFKPFVQASGNKSGLGLGLAIAKQSVEASGGLLKVQDIPGTGCIFTISLPRLT
jgi:signal transduction histidine kinase